MANYILVHGGNMTTDTWNRLAGKEGGDELPASHVPMASMPDECGRLLLAAADMQAAGGKHS